MKTIDVIFAFKSRRAAKTSHISTDGTKLFSYYTCIAQWFNNDTLIISDTKYSPTTSKHQTYLKNAVENMHGITILLLDCNIQMGAKDLTDYLSEQQKLMLTHL